jgi:hypothetical protein
MRTSRKFVPTSMSSLEGRVVLSAMAPATAAGAAAEIRPVHLTSAEVAQSNASEVGSGFDTGDTLRSGISVAEQRTTSYNDGSTETESLLTVPNLSNNTTTTYETINLRHNGGVETVVDTESFSGGSQPLSGTDNTHNLTITLPNGSTETETYHEVITGHKTVVTGALQDAGGGVQTWTAVKRKFGPTTVTTKMITEPNGSVEHQKNVTTRVGDLDSTSSTTTFLPDSSIQRSSSVTNVTRIQPPSS